MRARRLALTLSLTISGCGTGALGTASRELQHWRPYIHITRVLDLAGPRRDGSFVVAANGRLWVMERSGSVRPYGSGYVAPGGSEPYISVPGRGCFGISTVYALRLRPPRGVVAITPDGMVHPFAKIAGAPRGLIDGIAYDRTGRFGHRLLVTIDHGPRSTVVSIGCHGGAVSVITRRGPRVEGGIAVAPRRFGRFGGDVIAPDEQSGRIYAITPRGRTKLVAVSGLPFGQDIGVESLGFVPSGSVDAFVSDRRSRGSHPGDDEVLRLTAAQLEAAGVRPGDLLAVSEGGAKTVAVRCDRTRCVVRHVADGPRVAHGEGHVAFRR